MKDNQIVNGQVTADTAGAERIDAAAELGKFKDVKALMEAYQTLEAEFTRRSQRLKELEANKEAGAPVTADTEKPQSPSQRAEERVSESRAEAEKTAEQGDGQTLKNGAEKPDKGALPELSDEVKNAVIEEYLNGIFSKRGVPFVTGGGAVAAQRRTPKTLKEAGALAGKLFSNKEDN
ncbi:MAG: hypothetical protein K2K39_03830 [Clostridia bacterium]|nr:hypothetical protein [Clostridia bacterium]